MHSRREVVEIALVGKYVKLQDAYLSVHEALKHAGLEHGCAVRVRWVDAEDMSFEETAELLENVDGVLVPGGFGSRGWEGKILACRVARERRIPYLGICLGMHVAVSEFARHVVGLEGANSTEMDPETPYPVIDLLPEQKGIEDLGGTMRLGAQAVEVAEGTRTRELYGDDDDPRAAPAPLRGEQRVPRPADRGGPRRKAARSRKAGASKSSSSPSAPWFVASQFHRSSSPGRRGRRLPCAASSVPLASATRVRAGRLASQSPLGRPRAHEHRCASSRPPTSLFSLAVHPEPSPARSARSRTSSCATCRGWGLGLRSRRGRLRPADRLDRRNNTN